MNIEKGIAEHVCVEKNEKYFHKFHHTKMLKILILKIK